MFFHLTNFRELGQKYKHTFVRFWFKWKFACEIYWPLDKITIKCSPKWVKKLGVLAWKRNSFFLGVIYELSQIFQIFSIKTLSKYLHNINYLCYWGISASVNKVFFSSQLIFSQTLCKLMVVLQKVEKLVLKNSLLPRSTI